MGWLIGVLKGGFGFDTGGQLGWGGVAGGVGVDIGNEPGGGRVILGKDGFIFSCVGEADFVSAGFGAGGTAGGSTVMGLETGTSPFFRASRSPAMVRIW